jgi:hypothetical protein
MLRFARPGVAILARTQNFGGLTTLPAGLTAMPDGAVRTKLLMVLAREHEE